MSEKAFRCGWRVDQPAGFDARLSYDGAGRLSWTLGPAYMPRMGSEGRCPPNIQFLPVVADPRVQRGLAEVRRPGGGYVTFTLVRW